MDFAAIHSMDQEMAMAENARAMPPRKPKPPPTSRLTRLTLMSTDFVIDATRRADGTLNRGVLSLLDPPVPAIPTAWCGVATHDVVIDRSTGLLARLFLPSAAENATSGGGPPRPLLPVIIFFHGGGFAYLSAKSLAFDIACRRIARSASAAVLSVDYRRSPEHRFPAPYDDGLAALQFLDDPKKHHAAAALLDVSRCFLAGDSAGGNVAHHVARRYAANPSLLTNVRLAGLVAIQPFFGGEERTPAELRLDGAAPIVSIARTDWMWRAFLPPGADRNHETANFAAPAAAAGLDSPEFPPVLIVIGGYDPLQDWQRRYGEMLRARGKDVRVIEYPDAIHGFYAIPMFDDACDLMTRIAEFVAEN